jgi:cyanophycin synthetase
MKIIEIKTMQGPNYWSVRRHNLTVMVLDLEKMEQFPTNKIDGFGERLEKLFPSMYTHRCSVGCEGGFFQRVKDGTWMGHVIEHIALEIQTLAGMDVGFGRTRTYGEEGVYFVVFNHMVGKVGEYAAKASFNIAEALISGEPYDLEEDILNMKEIRQNEGLGPSTGSIIKEAEARNIPWIRLNRYSLCQLGYGANQQRIQATVTSKTSNIGVDLACDKEETKDLLEQAEVPTPKGDIIRTERGLEEAVDYVGFPLVIKPVNGNHGRGITTNINSLDEALIAFKEAKEISRLVIVEKFITGEDHRLLVIDNKLVAAAKRTAAHVIGDGSLTIQQLVDEVNKDERRGYGHEKVLTEIDINSLTLELLKENGMTPDSVPKKGEMVKLKSTANLSTGGTAEDITEMIHPYNVFMAERISKIIDLDICGIDIMADDLTKPLNESGGAVLEVNAGPGFRMHLQPTSGLPRNVGGHVVDMLFPPGSDSRIPIIAVTGTNGKTTTTRLIAHIAKMRGKKVGYTTTDGVYIQNRLLMTGDCTGPKSAEFVLKDPTVNFAVLECARGGLLRAGLGFKKCDIGVVTNVAGDHLGLKGIHTIDQLAKVKGVIPETVHKDGYSVLNADDDRVYAMRNNVESHFALFSMDEDSPRIKRHSSRGGVSAVYENGYVTIFRGEWKMRVSLAANVPLTKGGKAAFMIQNVLAGVLACYLHGFSIEDIKVAIESFIPSPSQTPGRLNMFNFNKFDLLLDYAHNPAGLRALHKYVEKLDGSPKVGIVAGVGDRRKEDNFELGQIAAEMFDEVIIRQDRNLRGKEEQELIDEIKAGIEDIDPNKPLKIIKKENEAIQYAVENAKEGSLIVISSDVVPDALNMVMKLKEKEAKKLYPNVKDEIPNIEQTV